jgi:diaminopimelate epimerase
MHGLGNDFVVIDGVNQTIELTPNNIQQMSARHTGIGFDQLLLIEKPRQATVDFTYRIFNADGSEVGQCGNGARCVTKFVYDKQLTQKKQIRIETFTGILESQLQDNGLVSVNMGIPTFLPEKIPFVADKISLTYPIRIEQHDLEVLPLSIGNPHCVLQVQNIQQAPVKEIGAILTKHQRFPEEVNVGFMQVINAEHIKLRVYERGVGETNACGSGACAAMIAGRRLALLSETVTVQLPGGELNVSWQGEGEFVYLTGPAVTVFEGTW